MTPLEDPVLPAAYRLALSENCRFSGYVTWKPMPAEWVFENLPGYSPKALSELMCDYVESGGEIDQVRGTREEWLDFGYHYDLRIPLEGRLIYIETVLFADDPRDPQISIVNIEYAWGSLFKDRSAAVSVVLSELRAEGCPSDGHRAHRAREA